MELAEGYVQCQTLILVVLPLGSTARDSVN
jgi:hypothetical protein